MSADSKIEWTDATWNPVRGCDYESPGCKNCYAARQAHRFSGPGQPYEGLTKMTKAGPVWTGKVRIVPELLEWPLRRWNPLRIFVNSMSDLFHEDVPDDFIDQVFAVMALAPRHQFQILTKRPQRMLDYMTQSDGFGRWGFIDGRARRILREFNGTVIPPGKILLGPLPHVWLGVSVERQQEADERISLLLQTPAAVRWVSAEPLLGPVELTNIDPPNLRDGNEYAGINSISPYNRTIRGGLDWVVAGGESGPGARPSHPDWFRSLRDQCAAAGVPFFFKQWGAWAPSHHYCDPDAEDVEEPCECRSGRECHITQTGHLHDDDRDGQPPPRTWTMRHVGKRAAGRLLDGRTHDEYPEWPSTQEGGR